MVKKRGKSREKKKEGTREGVREDNAHIFRVLILHFLPRRRYIRLLLHLRGDSEVFMQAIL